MKPLHFSIAEGAIEHRQPCEAANRRFTKHLSDRIPCTNREVCAATGLRLRVFRRIITKNTAPVIEGVHATIFAAGPFTGEITVAAFVLFRIERSRIEHAINIRANVFSIVSERQ